MKPGDAVIWIVGNKSPVPATLVERRGQMADIIAYLPQGVRSISVPFSFIKPVGYTPPPKPPPAENSEEACLMMQLDYLPNCNDGHRRLIKKILRLSGYDHAEATVQGWLDS